MGKEVEFTSNLVTRLKQGDYAAYDELFRIYSKKIYYYSKGFLKSKELSEDVLQSVFLTLWEKRENIKDASTFKSYLFTITYHKIVQELKVQKKHLSFEIEELVVNQPVDISTLENIEYHLTKNHIEKIVDTFPNRCKEVFKLSRFDDLSHKEIAEKLNISTKTVENQITKALSLLKKHISKDHLATLLFISLFL